MNPKVSVIIPVHNTAKYLSKCLNSICDQTLKQIEIICVNDASSDRSEQILREYAEKDNRIVLIDFNENRGVSAARNAGIEEATGDYIGFVDSDDRISPDFLEKLFSAASDGVDIVKGKVYRMVEDKVCEDGLVSFFDNNNKISENKGNFFFYFFSAIYRKDFIKENQIRFYEDLKYGEDLSFCANAVAHANMVRCLGDTFYYYIENEDSAMSRIAKDSFVFFHSEFIAVARIAEDISSGTIDWSVYDAQFRNIMTLVFLNQNNLHFDSVFKREWMKFVLRKYKGKQNPNLIFEGARLDYREVIKRCQLAIVRRHMGRK